jgi:SagB-type dehydrogenase family enzyme
MIKDIFFSRLFHQNTKKVRLSSFEIIPDWKTIYYKTYLRVPKIKLSHEKKNFDLFESIKNRKSIQDQKLEGSSIGLEELSVLLEYSCGITTLLNGEKDHRRAYPSGGARYPIEIYGLIAKPGEGLQPGIFHYNVKNHELEVIWRKKFSAEEIKKISSCDFINNVSLIVFMTAVFSRTQNKYGGRGYRFILQESGHIGQNFYLVSEALGLKCSALGGHQVPDTEIEEWLSIDGVNESLIYSVAIGK